MKRGLIAALAIAFLLAARAQAGNENMAGLQEKHPAPRPNPTIGHEKRERRSGPVKRLSDTRIDIRSSFFGKKAPADRSGRSKPSDQRPTTARAVTKAPRHGPAMAVGGSMPKTAAPAASPAIAAKRHIGLAPRSLKEELGIEARSGYTSIVAGSIGTAGGKSNNAYRGFETKVRVKGAQIAYGWADQFGNKWDRIFRDMELPKNVAAAYPGGRRIQYIHSLGGRFEFGSGRNAYVDAAVGEGHLYRRNAQLAAGIPFTIENIGEVTLSAYGMVAQYHEAKSGIADPDTEFHVNGSAQLKSGDWTFLTGVGRTHAPDSATDMKLSLTPGPHSDSRTFIQTGAHLDTFITNGQNVFKLSAKHDIGNILNLPGLRAGVSYNYGWNAKVPGARERGESREIDCSVEYAVREGKLKGVTAGVVAGNVRYDEVRPSGKRDRDDVTVFISYSRMLETFLGRK